jgi:hypothetical protein
VTLESLETLALHGRTVVDADVEALLPLSGLRNLDLRSTSVTDRGIAALKQLPCLESLNLAWTRVKGFCLRDLASLSWLCLLGCPVSRDISLPTGLLELDFRVQVSLRPALVLPAGLRVLKIRSVPWTEAVLFGFVERLPSLQVLELGFSLSISTSALTKWFAPCTVKIEGNSRLVTRAENRV